MVLPNPHPRGRDGLQALRSDIIDGIATQGYGHTGFENFHDGIDIQLPNMAMWHEHPPVHAPFSGTVTKVGWADPDHSMSYGQRVEITNAQGWHVMVGHLQDFYQFQRPGTDPDYTSAVRLGQQVYAGDTIGHMGSTGFSTGPHVHYLLHDPQGNSVNPTIDAPPFLGDNYLARTNWFYADDHDLGFGAGDNTNTQKWVNEPPPPGLVDAPIYRQPNGQLEPNPGNVYDPIPPGQPGTDPGGGVGIGLPPGTVCQAGTVIPTNADGTCPPGYAKQLAGGSMNTFQCQCLATSGQFPSITLPGFGDIGGSILQGVIIAGVALVGLVFIAAGLFSFTKEKPVVAITAPLANGAKGIGKIASVAA